MSNNVLPVTLTFVFDVVPVPVPQAAAMKYEPAASVEGTVRVTAVELMNATEHTVVPTVKVHAVARPVPFTISVLPPVGTVAGTVLTIAGATAKKQVSE